MPGWWVRVGVVCGGVLVALGAAAPAVADVQDETALAERYAPVLRLAEQHEPCGYGEPYRPMDVDDLFGQPSVALRGPWSGGDVVRIGPSAKDLTGGLYDYYLDFPGDPLNPGCGYEQWANWLTKGSQPASYAHVATDPAVPGKLGLAYWFFYAFNDFNNTHEGDWEMIQLIFDARDAHEALSRAPVEVGYSQHSGAERAAWGDDKLELVDGTHPVVHPAAGSHANYYTDDLYLGSSANEGFGCDDATGPSIELRPAVRTIPSDPALAQQQYPWTAFEGRWGELQTSFYNGPTGPNLKQSWTEPITAAQNWRDRSYAVPAGGVFGTGATDFFCSGVQAGSNALRRAVSDPAQVLVLLILIGIVGLIAIRATTWHPDDPLPAARRRAWGQVVATAGRMYRTRWPLFAGIGAVFIPIAAVLAAVEGGVFTSARIAGIDMEGESGGSLASATAVLAVAVTLAGVVVVQAATTRALAEVDAGRSISPLRAYKLVLAHLPRLLGALAIAIAVVAILGVTVVGLPIAVWLAGRWALLAQPVEEEHASAWGTLRRSSRLVRGHWLKTASLVLASASLILIVGPTLGALLIVATNAQLAVVNIVAGVVYVLAMPFVALTTAYVYHDAAVRAGAPRTDSDAYRDPTK